MPRYTKGQIDLERYENKNVNAFLYLGKPGSARTLGNAYGQLRRCTAVGLEGWLVDQYGYGSFYFEESQVTEVDDEAVLTRHPILVVYIDGK